MRYNYSPRVSSPAYQVVVLPPFLLIAEDFIGFIYLLEPLFSLSGIVGVSVRVIAQSQSAEGLLYILATGTSHYAKDLVVVLHTHHFFKKI